jgi:hypothetical protein
MKLFSLIVISLCITNHLIAQNTFPSTGNVGIGTTSPVAALSFIDVNNTSTTTGITWYNAGGASNSTLYGIHRTSGSWDAPNYQQLRVGFETGIVLDPGTLYGKSYVDIKGNGLRVTTGNVGIGTLDPNQLLVVAGSSSPTVSIFDNSGPALGRGGTLLLQHTNVSGSPVSYAGINAYAFDGSTGSEAGHLIFKTMRAGTLTEAMRLTSNGNVGIGTVNTGDANYKLFVETGIRTRKVKVDQVTWPDYVFAPFYHLPTLKEVEAFIKQHQHLTDVPSAKEIEKEGLDLGNNLAILLKKIEELTLYAIEQNKSIEAQQKEIIDLKKQIIPNQN